MDTVAYACTTTHEHITAATASLQLERQEDNAGT